MIISPLRRGHRHENWLRNVAASLPALLLALLLVSGGTRTTAHAADNAIAPEVQAAIDALPADRQSAVLEEISTVKAQCRREILGTFQRCSCLAARYAEARIQDLASTAHDVQYYMLRNLGTECRNRPAIVKQQASDCLRSRKQAYPYLPEEVLQEYCSCVSNNVADRFMEAGREVQIGIPTNWGVSARLGCGSGKLRKLAEEALRQHFQASD